MKRCPSTLTVRAIFFLIVTLLLALQAAFACAGPWRRACPRAAAPRHPSPPPIVAGPETFTPAVPPEVLPTGNTPEPEPAEPAPPEPIDEPPPEAKPDPEQAPVDIPPIAIELPPCPCLCLSTCERETQAAQIDELSKKLVKARNEAIDAIRRINQQSKEHARECRRLQALADKSAHDERVAWFLFCLLSVTVVIGLFLPRRAGACLLALVLTPLLAAQAEAKQENHLAAIVRVGQVNPWMPMQSASGVGTLVARDQDWGTVLTVAHVFRHPQGQAWVEWSDGRRVNATLLGCDHYFDIAVVRAESPPADVAPIPIAESAETCPRQNDTVEFIGRGGGQLRHFDVAVSGYTRIRDEPQPTQLIAAFGPIPGDSGGPVIYRDQVVAVNWGGPVNPPERRAYESHGTAAPTIQTLLTGWGCRGGSCRYPPPGYVQGPAQPITQPWRPAYPPPNNSQSPGLPIAQKPPDDSRLARIEQALENLAKREPIAHVDLTPIGAKIEALGQRLPAPIDLQPLAAKLDSLPEKLAQLVPAPTPSPLAGMLATHWLTALGFSAGPVGAVATAVLLLVRSKAKAASQATQADISSELQRLIAQQFAAVRAAIEHAAIGPIPATVAKGPTVMINTPPPELPQVVSTSQQFYGVQMPTVNELAREEAIRKFVQANPGLAAAFNQLQSWTDQIRSGMAGARS